MGVTRRSPNATKHVKRPAEADNMAEYTRQKISNGAVSSSTTARTMDVTRDEAMMQTWTAWQAMCKATGGVQMTPAKRKGEELRREPDPRGGSPRGRTRMVGMVPTCGHAGNLYCEDRQRFYSVIL